MSSLQAPTKEAVGGHGSSTNASASGRKAAATEKLLSRANTMLKSATMSRENSKPGTAQIKSTVKSLHREKTKLAVVEQEEEIDDDMKAYLERKKQERLENLHDSDFDTDLEDEVPKSLSPQTSPASLYRKTCKKLGIKVIPILEKQVESKEVKVVNRCLNALDILSLSNALISNQMVTRVQLDGNDVGDEGAQVIAWLLKDQESFVEKLSLADNNIGKHGFEAIGQMLMENRQLTSLNIAGNHPGEAEIGLIASALKQNHQLNYLNLGYNGIGDRGAKSIASAIVHNEGLSSLDLSWNKIRPDGGVAICNALKENVIIKTLNLSMNGLSNSGSYFIGEALKKNETLTYLDVTFNRIFDEGAGSIAKGLEKNEKLHHLIMHHNPVTSIGAMALLSAIRSNENTAMWKLDLTSVPVLKDVVAAYEEYNTKNEDFRFSYGHLLDSNPRLEGDMLANAHRQPMAIVREYIEEEGLRLMDFFKLMDRDHGGTITRAEFEEGLQQANVPMTKAQIEDMIEQLDKDGDGEIDYREFVDGDREFRRKRLRRKLAALEAMRLAMLNPEPEESWMV